ncbi:hypothetical protein GCM10009735_85750 [Actinomadura chokoriensis]
MPHLATHLTKHTKKRDDGPVFAGVEGGPLRRNGCNKLTRRTHFHDLRDAGNTLALTWASPQTRQHVTDRVRGAP